MNKATFILSLDCELLWGMHYFDERVEKLPFVMHYELIYDRLLKLLDEYNIAATFAITGSMLLNEEQFMNHRAMQNPGCVSWFERKKTIFEKHPHLLFNSEIINKIIDSKLGHEIASHSFMHIDLFNDKIVDEETASIELEESYKLLKAYYPEITTYIFPENKVTFLEAFRRSGYGLYRSNGNRWFNRLPFKRFFHLVDQFLAVTPRTVRLEQDAWGNYYLKDSMILLRYDGIRKVIPDFARFNKIKKGIDVAISRGEIFHIWFHPMDLGLSERSFGLLRKVFGYVDAQRRNGLIENKTMIELLNDTKRRENT